MQELQAIITENTAGSAQWVMDLADEAASCRVAARLAQELRAGDLVTLAGELGTGKTTFARAVIRALLDNPDAEVPSPTYTFVQTYDGPQFRIVHADLYRINDPSELTELGWEEAAENALVLVEWAERAGEVLAEDRVEVRLEIIGEAGGGRRLTLRGFGAMAARLERARAIQALLDHSGYGNARREFMLGDASVRSYERVLDAAQGQVRKPEAILMISPRRPDGPPIRLGKPYSALVHLAESVDAFVAMARGLRDQGFSAPEILGADLDAGLLLVEDLGPLGVIDENGPIEERYATAIDVLAELHARALPTTLNVLGTVTHALPRYDLEAMTIEAELLLDWYFPYAAKRTPNAGNRLSFVDQWISALEPVIAGEKSWVLRDYHSPNLIWLPEREGLNKIGLIDFQDAVIGPTAYDVASLLQDARVNVPEAMELKLLARYARQRRMRDPDFDMQAFAAAYAVMGAQRATKILGIFIRLDRRDGKPSYLKHLPRIEAYLRRCLAHPALAKLKLWYQATLPGIAPPVERDHADEDGTHDHQGDASGRGAGDAHAAADQHLPETSGESGRQDPAGS